MLKPRRFVRWDKSKQWSFVAWIWSQALSISQVGVMRPEIEIVVSSTRTRSDATNHAALAAMLVVKRIV